MFYNEFGCLDVLASLFETQRPLQVRSISFGDALLTSHGIALRGDGPPYWTEGRTAKPAIDAYEAARRRRNLANILMRVEGDKCADALALAQRLQACTDLRPCLSAACPICWRALRRMLVTVVRPHLPPNRIAFVTCISADDSVPYGSLGAISALWLAKQRHLRLVQRRRSRVLGAIDLSANEHEHGAFRPCWMIHPHFFLNEVAFETHRPMYEAAYSAEGAVFRPVLAKAYNGRIKGLAYTFDMPTQKRVSLARQIAPDGLRTRRDTRKKNLVKAQRIELALLLDAGGLDARIIMYGYELVTDGVSVWLNTVNRQRAEELLAIKDLDLSQRMSEQNARKYMRVREEFERRRQWKRT